MPTADRTASASVADMDDDQDVGVALDLLDSSALDLTDAPSLADVEAEAGLPVQTSLRDLDHRDLLWLAWRPQQAVLQETGEVTDGFFALVRDVQTQRLYTAFVGGIALRRTLSRLNRPFRARIEKHGRTWVFR